MADVKKYKVFENDEYEVLGSGGFENFKGLIVGKNKNKIELKFNNSQSLTCTPKHKLMLIDNISWVYAKDLTSDHILYNNVMMISSETLINDDNVYDFLEIENTHKYLINNSLESKNCLIIDEMAFIKNNIVDQFWSSVYPIISSAKGTKVIAVSTPNGVGNMFHQLWEKAMAKIKDKDGWRGFRVDWWEVPGHDKEWKNQQIISLGSEEAFRQEFGNDFLASSFKKLVPDDVLDHYRQCVKEFEKAGFTGEEIAIPGQHTDQTYSFKMWHDFDPKKTYLASADVADGSGGDSSVLYIWDITQINDIRMCAKYSSNSATVLEFAYIISRINGRYCNPVFAVESNSIGRGLIDQLKVTYGYDNFVKLSKKNRDGIMSHVQIKSKACLWFKEMLTTPNINITIYDRAILDEADNFVRKDTKNHLVYNALGKAHDDHMIAFIWGMYILHCDVVDKYFSVVEYVKTNLGKMIPSRIAPAMFYDVSKQDKDLAPNSLDMKWKKMKDEITEEVEVVRAREKMWGTSEIGGKEILEEDDGELFFSMGGGGWN